MKKTLLLLSFFVFTGTLLAQTSYDVHPCGTAPEKTEWLKKYQANRDAFPKSDETLLIPVTIHIVGKESGTGFFQVDNVLAAFCTLNEDFAPANIQFYIAGDFNYIYNNDYYDYDNFGTGLDMMDEYDVPNTINSYIVQNPAGTCGYNYPGSGRVALGKNCMQATDHTWAHEIGHDFSLPHTFYGWEFYDDDAVNFFEAAPEVLQINEDFQIEVEKTDGSNGFTSADGFSDTPADYLAFRWNCGADNLSNQTQLDPDTVQFVSDGTFFMSYAGDNCMSRFSDEQIEAMRASVLDQRQNLLDLVDAQAPLTDLSVTPITPLEDEVVPFYDEVTLEWEPVLGATRYYVEITPSSVFGFVLYKYVVNTNSLITNDLRQNRTYYWRVTPYNEQYTCVEPVGSFSFMTSNVTDIPVVEGLVSFAVLPNPANAGAALQLHFGMEQSLDVEINLYSITGQLLESVAYEALPGNNKVLWDQLDFPPGMYLIGLESGKGKHFEKIIIR